MSKRCSNCGHENRDVAEFCGNCGSRLVSQNMGNNFTGGSSSSSTNSKPKVTYATHPKGDNAGSLCCAVLIILFVIILIMSIGWF